jgi:hypothetical protein
VYKSVFIIFFQGEQLKSRVKKICEGFRATLYPCPDQAADRREMAVGVMQRLEDLNTVLGQTNDHRHRVLVAAAKNIKLWFVKVRKIKAICKYFYPRVYVVYRRVYILLCCSCCWEAFNQTCQYFGRQLIKHEQT